MSEPETLVARLRWRGECFDAGRRSHYAVAMATTRAPRRFPGGPGCSDSASDQRSLWLSQLAVPAVVVSAEVKHLGGCC